MLRLYRKAGESVRITARTKLGVEIGVLELTIERSTRHGVQILFDGPRSTFAIIRPNAKNQHPKDGVE